MTSAKFPGDNRTVPVTCWSAMPLDEFSRRAFTHDIYRRVQLAAAVLVIRSTPNGMSSEAHAADLQRKLKLLWLSSVSNNSPVKCVFPQRLSVTLKGFQTLSTGASQLNVSVDRHILFQLQELLAFRLNSVTSESTHHSLTVCSQSQSVSHATEQSNATKQHEIWKMQAFSDNFHTNRVKIQASANFIQAVIHLKALAGAQTTIPFNKYNTCVSLLCNTKSQVNFPYNSEESLFAHPLPSDDSGFCTMNDKDNVYKQDTEPVKGVASSVILYIVNSCNANELLQKSVESIIVQLRDIALKDDGIYLYDTINQWRGSAYHHAMVAFQSVFSGQLMNVHRTVPYQQLCLSILQEMLEHVSRNKYSTKDEYYLRENQTVMLFQLSHATNFCIQTLDSVFRKIEDFAHLVHWSDMSFEQPQGSTFYQGNELISRMQSYLEELELGYFVFSLAKTFLQNTSYYIAKEGCKQNSQRDQTQKNTPKTIGNLWRKHYSAEVNSLKVSSDKNYTSELKSKVNSWRHLLSDSFENNLFHNSLIAVTICDCLPLLTALDR